MPEVKQSTPKRPLTITSHEVPALVEPTPIDLRALPDGGADPLKSIRSFQRFHLRLTLIYGTVVILILVAVVYAFYVFWSKSEIESLQKRLLSLSTSLAQTIDADAISKFDLQHNQMSALHREIQQQFAAVVERDKDIDSVYVLRPSAVPNDLYFFVDYSQQQGAGEPGQYYSAEGAPIMLRGFNRPSVEDEPYRDEFGYTLSAYAPLMTSTDEVAGLVGVDVLATRLSVLENRILRISAITLIASVALITLVSLLVSRSIREPLRKVISCTGAVAGGNLDVRMNLQRHDEFGLLGEHFDKMTDHLKERQTLRDLFGRYVSEDVASALLAREENFELGGHEAIVTVLFCDLKDYTTISERLSPVQMVSMINEYLGVMNSVIDQNRGCVIEFLGDGILAVFGVPETSPDHAENATRCALAMREALEALNRQWQADGLAARWQELGVDRIECRIGLHTGPVVAGNLGSKTRMKYGVIGDTVNLAARLEGMNKVYDTTILMSDEVKSRLPNDIALQTRHLGEAQVKGRTHSIICHAI
ncbi:MAG TPA: hypothetical protein DCZ13_10540 [Porticoccaceae bacterium]|nr:hypothetical protein [Porticoccaceae bacterium]